MSWTAHVPDTPAAEIVQAIDECETSPVYEAELDPGPLEQLAVARAIAKELVASGKVKGDRFEIHLGGHCDPGDGSTQADYIHVQVSERPPRETPGHGYDARKREFHSDAEDPAHASAGEEA
jgi:hypothetical protein